MSNEKAVPPWSSVRGPAYAMVLGPIRRSFHGLENPSIATAKTLERVIVGICGPAEQIDLLFRSSKSLGIEIRTDAGQAVHGMSE